jgi:hypothetical protein
MSDLVPGDAELAALLAAERRWRALVAINVNLAARGIQTAAHLTKVSNDWKAARRALREAHAARRRAATAADFAEAKSDFVLAKPP